MRKIKNKHFYIISLILLCLFMIVKVKKDIKNNFPGKLVFDSIREKEGIYVYEKNKLDIRKQDKLRQVIPLMGGQSANQFQIVVGFQLSDAELAYNRSGKK